MLKCFCAGFEAGGNKLRRTTVGVIRICKVDLFLTNRLFICRILLKFVKGSHHLPETVI